MNSTQRFQRITLALIAGTYLLGCLPEGGGDPTGPGVVAAVQIIPGVDTLRAFGATAQYAAVTLNAAGDTTAGATISWSSSATDVVTMSASGLATAVSNGTATITATSGSVSGVATVTVAQSVATVDVTPAAVGVTALGATQQFTAAASDANSNPMPGVTFLWASSDVAVATVDATGLATVTGQGSVTITADAQGVIGSAVLNSTVPISTIVVSPANAAIDALQATAQLSAAAEDASGNPVSGVVFNWMSSDASVATVDASGLVTARGNGTATITASAGLASGSASVSVDQAVSDLLSSVVVTPPTVRADGTTTAVITVAARDANGNPVSGKTIELAATGVGNTLTQPAGPTDPNGLVTGTIASNTAETKTISAKANPGAANEVTLIDTETIDFTASQLVFTVQPTATTASEVIAPAVEVSFQDAAGNVVTTATSSVTLSLGSNPAGGAVWGTSTVSPVAGIATFSDVSVDVAATGHTLVASAGSVPSGTSATFDVLSGFVSATTLAATVSNCDDCSQNVPIGFSFSFYGTAYTSINVVSNGFASFVTTLTSFSNSTIPNASGPQGFVAPFWDDLLTSNISGTGDIFTSTVGVAPNRRFIVEYRGVDFFGSTTGPLTFEIILNEGTDIIEFVYGSLSSSFSGRETGSSATVGMENATGTVGLQVGYNNPTTVTSGQRMIFSFDGSNYSRVR